MVVGSLEVQLTMAGCRSLKDKRRILQSLIERLRRDFHVAVAEVEDHELWGNATLGIACVSVSATHVESVLQHVLDSLDSHADAVVEGVQREIWRPDYESLSD